MKYHKHEIKKIKTIDCDDDCHDYYEYEIFKDKKFITVALTLESAKEFIDANYDYSCL